MTSEFITKIIGVIIVVLLITVGLVPFLSEVGRAHDADPIQAPIGAYDTEELDGYSLTASRYGGHVKVESTFYTGEIKDKAVIMSTSDGSLWTDGSRIYIQTGNTVRTVTSTTVTVEGGVFQVDGETVGATGTVYLPDSLGSYGSYPGTVHGDIISGVGSFAGVTVGSIGEDITGNNTDYVLDASVGEVGGLNGLEYVAGEVDVPEIDPFLPDIEHEEEPIEPIEPGEYVTSGTTGSCTWELDGTVLYISGTGATGTYSTSATNNPGYGLGFTEVVVGEGVTKLGSCVFNKATALKKVVLPSTLLDIGVRAFRQCYELRDIEIPSNVKTIDDYAFLECRDLHTLILPESLTSLGTGAISGCTSLTHLYVPENATVASQTNFHFIRLDGYDMGSIPVGDLYLGTEKYVMYQTKTVTVDGAVYHVNYIGAELETAVDTETVHVPYTVEYNGKDYTVESIAHDAISGSSVRYVVIPQTVESISSTALTGARILEVLNLSTVDITVSHGEVRTSIPAMAVVSTPVIDPGFGVIMDILNALPLILMAALVLFVAVGMGGARRND